MYIYICIYIYIYIEPNFITTAAAFATLFHSIKPSNCEHIYNQYKNAMSARWMRCPLHPFLSLFFVQKTRNTLKYGLSTVDTCCHWSKWVPSVASTTFACSPSWWDVDQTMGFNMFKFVMPFLTPPPQDFGSFNDSISSQQILGWATSSPFFCSCWAFSGPAGVYLQKPLIMLKYVVISCGDSWKCSPIWVSS